MTTYGLTSTGFVPKTYAVIFAEICDDLKVAFGSSIDLSAQSVFGQLAGIMAERLSEVWDAAQDVHGAFNPDQASGDSLDGLCAITGVTRLAATHSTVTLTLTGDDGTLVPAGKQVSVTSTGVKFETLADATITGTGTFTPTVTVSAQAVETGPLVALSGTITTIETPVAGWTGVTNASDATVGRDVETDAALRLRRELALRSPAYAALEAVRSQLLNVTGVSQALVFENVTDATDGDGLPPHSIEAVVSGTYDDADVAEAVFESVAAGIATYGTSTETVTDTQGVTHSISFSDATDKLVYLSVTITKDADEYPADGDDQVLAAILAYGTNSLVMGKNVVAGAIAAQAYGIPGVLEVTVLQSLTNPPASSTTIPIGLREIALLDSSRTTITSSDGTP